MNKRRPIAVFDIDGTIFRSSLFIEYVAELEKLGAISPEFRASIEKQQRAWQERVDMEAYAAYLKQLVHSFDTYYLKNISRAAHQQALQRTLATKGKFVYTYTRDLVKRLRSEGYNLIAISGSPQEAVEEFTRPLGFDICSGLRFGYNDQTLTEVLYVPDRDKAADLQRIVHEHGLSLVGSIAVGDTASDIPMLSLVDQPIAFNPNRQLFDHAKAHDWKIVIERKNMVYELAPTKAHSYQLT